MPFFNIYFVNQKQESVMCLQAVLNVYTRVVHIYLFITAHQFISGSGGAGAPSHFGPRCRPLPPFYLPFYPWTQSLIPFARLEPLLFFKSKVPPIPNILHLPSQLFTPTSCQKEMETGQQLDQVTSAVQ